MARFWVVAPAILLAASAASAATYTVTSTADSGAGTLRQAILDANAAPGADTIAFGSRGADRGSTARPIPSLAADFCV